MNDDDFISQEELDDAVIEDTVHCDLCGGSFVLGGCPDYVIVESTGPSHQWTMLGGQLKLCVWCAQLVVQQYRDNLREAGICEHGLPDTEYCELCNQEYKRAAREHYGEDVP